METPNDPTSGQQTTDTGAGELPLATDALAEKLNRASDRAVNAFTPPKRKPGQRGPDKVPGGRRKPARVPVASMDGSSAETLLEESETLVDSAEWQAAPGIDAESAQALADVVYELFKDGRENYWRLQVLKETGSQALADAFIKPISEKLEAAMRSSAKACVLKYGAQIEYAPEITFLGAAAVIVVSDWLRFRGLKKDAANLQAKAA